MKFTFKTVWSILELRFFFLFSFSRFVMGTWLERISNTFHVSHKAVGLRIIAVMLIVKYISSLIHTYLTHLLLGSKRWHECMMVVRLDWVTHCRHNGRRTISWALDTQTNWQLICFNKTNKYMVLCWFYIFKHKFICLWRNFMEIFFQQMKPIKKKNQTQHSETIFH